MCCLHIHNSLLAQLPGNIMKHLEEHQVCTPKPEIGNNLPAENQTLTPAFEGHAIPRPQWSLFHGKILFNIKHTVSTRMDEYTGKERPQKVCVRTT